MDTNITEKMKSIAKFDLTSMHDNTAVIIISLFTYLAILIALWYYFYYTGSLLNNSLQVKECDYIDEIYSTLNGKIHPITTSEPFHLTFKEMLDN